MSVPHGFVFSSPLVLPPPGWFAGLLVVGWGLFNLVEGVINHHLLDLHHVRDVPRHVPAYDWVFLLAGGLGPLALGGLLTRAYAPPDGPRGTTKPATLRSSEGDP